MIRRTVDGDGDVIRGLVVGVSDDGFLRGLGLGKQHTGWSGRDGAVIRHIGLPVLRLLLSTGDSAFGDCAIGSVARTRKSGSSGVGGKVVGCFASHGHAPYSAGITITDKYTFEDPAVELDVLMVPVIVTAVPVVTDPTIWPVTMVFALLFIND